MPQKRTEEEVAELLQRYETCFNAHCRTPHARPDILAHNLENLGVVPDRVIGGDYMLRHF